MTMLILHQSNMFIRSVDWPWQRWFFPACWRWCCDASRRASECWFCAESVGRRYRSPSHQTFPTNLTPHSVNMKQSNGS